MALDEALTVIKQQAVTEQKQAEADQHNWCSPAVIINGTLTLIGLGYLAFMYLQWKEIEKQAIIANNTLTETKNAAQGARQNTILQFRRKLTIRNMVVTPALGAGFDEDHQFLFHQGEPVTGQFYVSNVGGVAAHTAEVGCWVEWFQGQPPMQSPYEAKDGNTMPFIRDLRSGESTPGQFNTANDGKIMDPRADDILTATNGWSLYIMGWVEYADDLGLKRRTAFGRKYDAERRRFAIFSDPDYEQAE